jgi:adenylate cyclase
MAAQVIALVFIFFSGERVGVHHLSWLLLGLFTGVMEEFLFGRRFRGMAIPLQFLGKAILLNLFNVGLIALAFAIDRNLLLPELGRGDREMIDVLEQASYYELVIRVVLVSAITILVIQLEETLGRRMFFGFLLGWYEKPKATERIILTMDLMGSTGLAERLGDLRYFRFLNRTHSLMSNAVLRNEAEIHKYVGDEVIFTWKMSRGLRHQNCLDLHFDIEAAIQAHANDFEREFGAVPVFRAAVHGGRVITARIGHIKRAFDFSGDVMNSVSRMLGLCKQLNAGLLASSELLSRMPGAEERFTIGEEHVLPVKGRRKEVRVRIVRRNKQVA